MATIQPIPTPILPSPAGGTSIDFDIIVTDAVPPSQLRTAQVTIDYAGTPLTADFNVDIDQTYTPTVTGWTRTDGGSDLVFTVNSVTPGPGANTWTISCRVTVASG